jgi:hypothetical protein
MPMSPRPTAARRPKAARRPTAALRAVAVLLLAAALMPALARADGDPASDVLLGENVFYPYSPPVSQPLQNTLNTETAAAARGKFPIKVALVASPVDLGVIPDLFGRPQEYADFLDQEISFQTRQPLLVVMPDGFGVQGVDSSARAALTAITKPAGPRSDDLARAAIGAVAKLAAAAGHPVRGVPGVAPGSTAGSGSSSTRTILLIALIIAAVITAGGLLAVRRRRGAPA